MPLPTSTAAIPLAPTTNKGKAKQAFLIRFPEDAWAQLEASAGPSSSSESISISIDNGSATLHIPHHPSLALKPQSSGTLSEIHLLSQSGPSSSSSNPSLAFLGSASTRLNLPLPSASTSAAASRLKASNEALEREKKQRADRVNGTATASSSSSTGLTHKAVASLSAGVGMTRTHSSPAVTSRAGAPMIPLKTRVVQLLALGETSVKDLVGRVGGAEQDVMRVVKVVGRQTSSLPPMYTLLPSQYAKLKIPNWGYTYSEKLRVVALARAAFDELELPSDADERADLDKKEQEVLNGSGASNSGSDRSIPEKPPSPISQPPGPLATPARPDPPPPSAPAPRTASPAPSAGGKEKKRKKEPVGIIGKQMAKFAKEKRASSLPNAKSAEEHGGRASPRPSQLGLDHAEVVQDKEETLGKRKRGWVAEPPQEEVKGKRRDSAANGGGVSPALVEERGRARDVKPPAPPTRQLPSFKTRTSEAEVNDRERKHERNDAKQRRPSRDYSSESDGEGEFHAQAAAPTPEKMVPANKRKAPPPQLKLNGSSTPAPSSLTPGTTTRRRSRSPASTKVDPPDEEELRERYEELFPAYQLLTKRLVKLHRASDAAARGDEVVNGDRAEVDKAGGEDGVRKLVARWERWHKELEGIRRWFAEG